MREMKDSGIKWIGEIPKDWKTTKLKYTYNNSNIGEAIDKDNYGEGSIIFYTAGMSYTFMSYDGFPEWKYTQSNDILLARNGTPYVYLPQNGAAYSDHIIRIDIKKEYDKRFLRYSLQRAIGAVAVETVSISTWSVSLWKEQILPLPNYESQRKIADYLDEKCSKIDAIIEKQQEIIEKLKEYKLSVISETVTKGLNSDVEMKDSGVESIGFVPKDWKICRLRNIGVPQNGISKGGEYFGSGDPFVSYGDVYKNYSLPNSIEGLIQSTEDEKEKYSVEEGDIFFTRTSETIDEVGFSCVCEETIPNATFAGFLIRVRPFDKDSLYIGFAKYYFRSNYHRKYYAKEMNLVTRASLGQDLLKSVPVLLPPSEEQRVIAKYLDKKCTQIEKIINDKEILIQRLSEYKESLIFEAVTGKKGV